MCDINSSGKTWPQTKEHKQLGLENKGHAINNWDMERLDLQNGLQNGLALGCYQPSPEVLILFPLNYT